MRGESPETRAFDRFQIGILLIVILIRSPFVFAGQYEIMEWFRTDDAFYYFKTAQNISEGLGVTFDGTAPTNGFQPLWMALMVPIFSLARFDLFLPLRLVILLQTVMAGFTGVLLYRLMSRSLSKPVSFAAALAYILLPRLHHIAMIGGTEAGINALMIALLLHQGSVESDRSNPRMLQLGLVGALGLFARLDNVFLVGVMGIWVIVVWFMSKESSGEFDRGLVLRPALGYYLPLALLGGAYSLFNLVEFGYPTPISAQVKHWWGTLDLTVYGFPIHRPVEFLGQFMTDDPALGPWSLITAPLYDIAEALMGALRLPFSVETRRGFLFVEALVISALTWEATRLRDSIRSLRRLPLLPLLLACLMQITYYKVSGHLAQKPWYWVGEGVFIVLLAAVLVDTLYQVLHRFARGKLASHAALGLLLLGLLLPQIQDTLNLFGSGKSAQAHFYIRRVEWILAHTEPGAKIGMTGSGSTGYFTPARTIINLDGLISGVEYFEALRDGTAAEYLEGIGLDYVFGNEYVLLETQPYREVFTGNMMLLRNWPDSDRPLRLWRFAP